VSRRPIRSIALGTGPEFDLIRRFLDGAGALPPGVTVGPGDDCAVVEGAALAVSTDLSVEDVHFRRAWLAPEEIGYRAAAAALSDLAAVAARPVGVLVSLAAPAADAADYAVRVMDGVHEAAQAADAALIGGDVAASPHGLVLDVTVVGEAPQPVLRSGARPGDELWVSGALGGAAAAVHAWMAGAEPPPAARKAFARPRPRTREAQWLAARGVLHAMLDLSDGLAGDAGHLAAASGVRIILFPDAIPVHPAVPDVLGGTEGALRLALGGGEDYELCFTAPPGVVAPLAHEFETEFGTPLTRVGRVVEGAGLAIRSPDGATEPLDTAGFSHFRGEGP